ncbi:MAG: hypothetical protein DWQ02_25350 [Bacteroidetes bacterium]|nr:MAG: hypothetical protein DWQ02_25350 [Bacteroidota bacterium]
MKKFFTVILLFTPFFLLAQLQKSFHQVYEVSDSVQTLELRLYGEFEHKAWAGNTIMLQTKVTLYDANNSILKFFMENGRYEVTSEQIGNILYLTATDQERRIIKSDGVECYEVVEQKIYIPDSFLPTGDDVFTKAIEENGTHD